MMAVLARGTRALAAAIALSACGGATRQAGELSTAPARVDTDSVAIARARADSVRHPYTAADVHFMTAMIGHHAQAVRMGHLADTRAKDPAVKTLARRVINGQQDEIARMQQWLRDRRQPVPEPGHADSASAHHAAGGSHGAASGHHGAGAGHAGMHHGTDHAMSMPGMLSEAQLAQLAAARGEAFDRLFLTYMIQHHRGAVTMVERLFGTYGAAQDETVFKFASDVNVDQVTEIARMEQMLRALVFEAPAP